MPQPLITAIVSTYSAERFMRSCLEDLVEQTLFSEMEVLVIDSGSPQGESAICEEFVRKYPQIKLLRTEREPLYVAWNRAIPLARGQYLTNANTDDRHHPDFMATMVAALESHPEAALAYADQLISHTENESFAECESRGAKLRRWPDYTPEDLLLRCITGSQPVWRKSLHSALGVFDTSYRIAADYDMWLRFASQHPLLHVPKALGVFFDSPHTISGASNQVHVNLETLAIQKTYVDHPNWRGIPKMRKRLAAELFGRGYQHIERDHNVQAAQPFIREAVKLDPTNLRFLKTYAVRCLAGIQ
ncbi:Glycosyltransferase involved in cell wall bisynthesis [Rhodoferax sp. OV413]|uniref:glycosyltransferase n=1 Tax=Rhodoferax sp. OV413 TaxID=1855285 RepID=UPI0008803A56|nr:glycosyltransferase [Rhodoferax sp. OV413]SDO21338.1 Glycosyltransferase involved in cell wall bisynthesis [Rhodoferax sp. OV413]